MLSKVIKDIIENNELVRYKDISQEFPEVNRKIFSVDPYAQIGIMSYSMANYYPLIKDIIDYIKPKSICEIGVDRGFTTYLLRDIAEKYNSKLYLVDPTIDTINFPIKADFISIYRETSHEYLKRLIHSDIYFIDGEHTYDSLFNELLLIKEENVKSGKYSVIFLHDMSWPHSYRDVIYNRENYPFKNRELKKGYLFPTTSDFVEYGLPMFYGDGVVVQEGGEKNGLLKAVEDFLEENEEYDFCSIPSIYGFGILWNKKVSDNGLIELLNKKKYLFEQIYSFLGFLELDRIFKIAKIEELFQKNNLLLQEIDKFNNKKNKLNILNKSKFLETFLFYHKKTPILLENEYFTPIQVGAEINKHLDLNILKDNDGDDNISILNPYVAEFSGWYYVWKNYDISSDYIGFGHYRRLLALIESSIPILELTPSEFLKHKEKYGFVDSILREFLYEYDILLPKKNCVCLRCLNDYADSYIRKNFEFYTYNEMIENLYKINKNAKDDTILTMREHYYVMHIGRDFEIMMDILEKHTERDEFEKIQKIANSKCEHNGNLVIMKKEIFFKYMNWVFPILKDLLKTINYNSSEYGIGKYQRRVFGFLSERLLNLYIYSRNYKVFADLPIINLKESSFSSANMESEYIKVDTNYLYHLEKNKYQENSRCYKLLKKLRSRKITNKFVDIIAKIYDKLEGN